MLKGEFYETTKSGKLIIERYVSSVEVYVKFLNTGNVRKATAQAIRQGNVNDPNKVSVFGKGAIGSGKYKSLLNGSKNPAYLVWYSMLSRCYNPKDKYYSIYGARGAEISKDWLVFQDFAEFYFNNYLEGTKLDKDIKVIGNTLYSRDTCLFVPESLNGVFISGVSNGVHYLEGRRKYQAIISKIDAPSGCKEFFSYEDARRAYLEAKQNKVDFLVGRHLKIGNITEEAAKYCSTFIERYLKEAC